MADKTAVIFCTQCAEDKPHVFTVDGNNEIVATDDQGHFLKFSPPQNANQLQEWIAMHKAHNADRAIKAAADNQERARVEKILEGLG